MMVLRALARVGVFLVAAASVSLAAKPPCVPAELPGLIAPRAKAQPVAMNVFLDGSQSMSGFAQPSDSSVKALGDILGMIANKSSFAGTKVSYFAFGKKIAALTAAKAAEFATTAPYNCTGCDNQESHIDEVLGAALSKPANTLTVIVTDMWLDNRSFHGSAPVALGAPLKQMLAQRRTIGVVGISAPFRGKIYDIPNQGAIQFNGLRPLIMLVVGPEAEVSAFIEDARQSGSAAFNTTNMRYTLFSAPKAAVPMQEPGVSGGGVGKLLPISGLTWMPHFAFDRSLAGKQKGEITGRYNAASGMPPGAMWSGKLAAKARVWVLSDKGNLAKCGPGTWSEVAPLVHAWSSGPDKTGIFAFNSKNSSTLAGGRTYLVAGLLGTEGLTVPNPASAWLREWSLDPAGASAFARTKPKQFKTLNLADVATLLEQGVVGVSGKQQMRVGFTFIVSVE